MTLLYPPPAVSSEISQPPSTPSGSQLPASPSAALPPQLNNTLSNSAASPPSLPLQYSQTVYADSGLFNSAVKIVSSNSHGRDNFGSTLAIDRSGRFNFVGAPKGDGMWRAGTGTVFVYDVGGSLAQCVEVAQISPPGRSESLGSAFGSTIAISGSDALVGAPGYNGGHGAVFILRLYGHTWALDSYSEMHKPMTSTQSRFGASIALFGTVAVVGEPGRGNVHVYEMNSAGALIRWKHVTSLTPENSAYFINFGAKVAVTENHIFASSGGHTSVVHVFRRHEANIFGGQWRLEYIISRLSVNSFGHSIAVDRDQAIIGAPFKMGGGAAYVYERSGTSWLMRKDLGLELMKVPRFGESVSILNDRAVVGAPSTHNSGMHIFEKRHSSSWDRGCSVKTVIGDHTFVADREYGLVVQQSSYHVLVGTNNRNGWFNVPSVHGAYLYEFAHSATTPNFATAGICPLQAVIFGFVIPVLALF